MSVQYVRVCVLVVCVCVCILEVLLYVRVGDWGEESFKGTRVSVLSCVGAGVRTALGGRKLLLKLV